MKTTVENLDPSRIKLTVEVPYEELKPSLDAAYKEIGSQIQVPGFRRGHDGRARCHLLCPDSCARCGRSVDPTVRLP